jgi:hypothetical protein
MAPSFFKQEEAILDEVLLVNFVETSVGRTASAP